MLAGLVYVALAAGEYDKAIRLGKQALALVRAAGDRRREAIALGYVATVLLEQDAPEARDWFGQCLAVHRELGSERNVAAILATVGLLDHLDGRLLEARRAWEEAAEVMRRCLDTWFEGLCALYLGRLSAEEEDHAAAQTHLDYALARIRAAGDPRHEACILDMLAVVRALTGDVEAAHAWLAVERQRETERYVHPHLWLAESRRLHAAGALDEARALREQARTGLAAVRAQPGTGLEVRLLAAHLERTDREASSWTFHRSGSWFRAPGAEPVDLGTGRPVVRLLAHLVQQRDEAPGTPCSIADLADAAWPDTRLVPGSAENRIRVAISGLRKAGLRPVLQRTQGAYLLDPEAPVRVLDASP